MKMNMIKMRALKGLGLFLVCMILFTLLSRGATNLVIPKAEVLDVTRGSLEYRIDAAGNVEENQIFAVTTIPGLRIAKVFVHEGDQIKAGDPLFSVDSEDLEEQILRKNEEIKKLDLGIQDSESQKRLALQDRENTMNRAKEDYNSVVSSQNETVKRTYDAMVSAKNQLRALKEAQNNDASNQPDLILDRLTKDCEEKKTAKSEAEKALKKAEADEDKEDIKAAKNALEKAEIEAEEADLALEQYQTQKDSDATQAESQQLSALEDAYRQTQNAYEEAVRGQEQGVKNAKRQVEDAGKSQASDNTGEISRIDREILEKDKEKLETLLNQKGVINAEVEGIVLEILLETGNDTVDGKNMAIADLSSGSRFVAQLTKDQQKFIKVGSDVLLRQENGKEDITGLKVNSIKENKEDPLLMEVTVLLPDNQLELGSSASMVIEKKSTDYASTIPIGALRMDDRNYFVLIPEEKETVLGSELVARKVSVEILEKNDALAAVKEDGLFTGQSVIVSTSKPVEDGDRICLMEKKEE